MFKTTAISLVSARSVAFAPRTAGSFPRVTMNGLVLPIVSAILTFAVGCSSQSSGESRRSSAGDAGPTSSASPSEPALAEERGADQTQPLTLCEQFCTRATERCPRRHECLAYCEETRAKQPTICMDVRDALLECAATRGTEYTCNQKGYPAVTKGCDPEAAAVFQCVLASADAGSPDAH